MKIKKREIVIFLLSLVIWANLSLPLSAAGCQPDEHEFEITIIEYASPDEDGLREFVCVKCGYSYTEIIPRSGHHYGDYEIEIPADCAHEGVKFRECLDCGAKEYEIIPYTDDHKFGGWETVTEPLCTTAGLSQRRCTECGTTEDQIIPPTGEHQYEETVHPATCTEDGEKVYQCQTCDDSYSEKIPALGHKWGEKKVAKEPTTVAEGMTRRVCEHDPEHVLEEAIPMLPPETVETETESETESETEPEVVPEPKKGLNKVDVILGSVNFSTFWLFLLLIRRDYYVINWDKRKKDLLSRKGVRK